MTKNHWHKIIDVCNYCNVSFYELTKDYSYSRVPICVRSARVAIYMYLIDVGISQNKLRELKCFYNRYELGAHSYLVEESKGLKKLIEL
jgi:hypothetical protein